MASFSRTEVHKKTIRIPKIKYKIKKQAWFSPRFAKVSEISPHFPAELFFFLTAVALPGSPLVFVGRGCPDWPPLHLPRPNPPMQLSSPGNRASKFLTSTEIDTHIHMSCWWGGIPGNVLTVGLVLELCRKALVVLGSSLHPLRVWLVPGSWMAWRRRRKALQRSPSLRGGWDS